MSLSSLPLPDPAGTTDKYERGTVLVVGGSASTPGAVRLAGVAALRVGAGRLELVTDAAAVSALGVAVPEARVVAFEELDDLVPQADVVLCGVGMFSGPDAKAVLERVVAMLDGSSVLIVDAGALYALAENTALLRSEFAGRCVLTPNPKELAALLARDEDLADPDAALRAAVERFGAVVSLRGVEARTAAPDHDGVIVDTRGNAGLGTSGSGDVAVGAIAGLAARGAPPLAAAAWGNHLHRIAGERCAESFGPVGYLASDLLAELPRALRDSESHTGTG